LETVCVYIVNRESHWGRKLRK